MTIALRCPGCSKSYELDDSLAGRRARCKQCGFVMQIPVPRGFAPGRDPAAATRMGIAPAPPAPSGPAADHPAIASREPVVESPYDFDADPDPSPLPQRAGFAPPAPEPSRPDRSRSDRPSAGRAVDRIEGRIPLLIRIGLGLIGGLVAFGAIGSTIIAYSENKPHEAHFSLALLAVFVSIGVVLYAHLKLLFMAVEEGTLGDSLTQLVAMLVPPLYLFMVGSFVVRCWDETRRVVVLYAAGLLALVAWLLLAPPYLNPRATAGAARSAAGRSDAPPTATREDPGPTSADEGVDLAVTGVPSAEAAELLSQAIDGVADPESNVMYEHEFRPGRPIVYRVQPLGDPDAFAARLRMLRVERVAGRRLFAAVEPEAIEDLMRRNREQDAGAGAPGPPPAVEAGPVPGEPEPADPPSGGPGNRPSPRFGSPDAGDAPP